MLGYFNFFSGKTTFYGDALLEIDGEQIMLYIPRNTIMIIVVKRLLNFLKNSIVIQPKKRFDKLFWNLILIYFIYFLAEEKAHVGHGDQPVFGSVLRKEVAEYFNGIAAGNPAFSFLVALVDDISSSSCVKILPVFI